MTPAHGIALKLISTFVFTAMAALIALLARRGYPTGELMFFRSSLALLPLFVWLAYTRHLRDAITVRSMSSHLKRGFFGCSSMFLGFLSLHYIPLADATAIGYASPIIVILLAGVLLGETVTRARLLSVLFGMSGVLIILSPLLGAGNAMLDYKGLLGSVFAFAGAIATAFAVVQIRQISLTETAASIVLIFMLFCAFLGLLTLPFGWVMPTAFDFGLLVLIGIFGGIGQILITIAYRLADASVVVGFDYVSMLWSVLFGFLLWNEVPGIAVLFGSAIIILSSLWLIIVERKAKLDSPK